MWTTRPATVCPFCGGAEREQALTHDGLTALICTTCTSIYLAEQPDPDDYRRFYHVAYRADYEPRDPAHLYDLQVPKTGRIIEFVAPFLMRRADMAVLDIGASAGGTLRAFDAAGATRAVGIEISSAEAEYARRRGHDVRTGTLSTVEVDGGFDLAVLSGTIDHLDDPAADLRRIRELLKPDGFLYIAISDLTELARSRRDPLKPEHLTYYTSATLRSVIQRHGFRPVRWRADTAAESRIRHPDLLAGPGPWLTIEGLFQVEDGVEPERVAWQTVVADLSRATATHRPQPLLRRAARTIRRLGQ